MSRFSCLKLDIPFSVPLTSSSVVIASIKNETVQSEQTFVCKPVESQYKEQSPSPSSSPITPYTSSSPISSQEEEEEKEEEKEKEKEKENNMKLYNLVILDWDDTLCPTTYIRNVKNAKETDINYLELQVFGACLYELLDQIIKTYEAKNIYIITNASKQWVYKSMKDLSIKYQSLCDNMNISSPKRLDYFAAIYNSFCTLNIGIISAFDVFHEIYPNQPLLWKINAFKQITKRHFSGTYNNKQTLCKYNIVSIGDSDDEYTASLEAKSTLKQEINDCDTNILLHRIKLRDDPSINDMMKQMKYLTNHLYIIYNANEPITMRFDCW